MLMTLLNSGEIVSKGMSHFYVIQVVQEAYGSTRYRLVKLSTIYR